MSRWVAEGRALGQSLRRFHAVVVAAGDVDAAADVALGVAEAQSAGRRVILGDLTGNSTRFGAFVTDDDPHGLVDAFDYGISLARVTREVEGHHNLQFVPTGSTAPEYAELLAHPRWSRLFTSAVEADHLLVLVVPVGAQGLDDLVHQLDGLILVDSLAPARVDTAKVIANVVLTPEPPPPDAAPASTGTRKASPPAGRRAASRTVPRTAPVGGARPVASAQTSHSSAGAAQTSHSSAGAAQTSRPSTAAASAPPRRQTTVIQAFAKPAGYGAGLSILAAFVIFWLMNLPFGDNEPRNAVPGPLQTAAPPAEPAPPPDPNQANPADSGAAAYAVRMMSANTQAGAILRLQEYGTSMPAATYAEVQKAGQTWYEVLTGAYTTRGGADSLLTSLRAAGHLDSISPGVVVRVPFAVRIDSVRKADNTRELLMNLRMRQLPVYGLEQRNGWVWVVVGAFETRSQADSYSEKIRASGQPAEVVLRQGRMF